MRERLRRFMIGRYGNDEFNQFIFTIAIVSMVMELITRLSLFYILTVVLLVFGYMRTFSKNINKRYAENMKYIRLKQKVLDVFRKRKYYASQRKDFHIYTCPQCRQKIRIPRGKGKISITCPKCKTSFIKRS